MFAFSEKMERLIISMFHSVPGVPCVKMERFADAFPKNFRFARG